MRAFIALEPPDEFVDDVAAVARRLAPYVEGRFVPPENYHLTLAFLGDITESQAEAAMDAVEEACAGQPPITLEPHGLGCFGRGRAATLWLGFSTTPQLEELADRTRRALTARGLAFDGKPFRPHLTLARAARLPQGPLPDLPFPAQTEARLVTLLKSTLHKEGATYKPLYSVELAGWGQPR